MDGNYLPLCQCGKKILTDVRSAGEQVRWAERLDVSWGYRLNGTAPNVASGASRLVCGDYFYLTAAAPERRPNESGGEACCRTVGFCSDCSDRCSDR